MMNRIYLDHAATTAVSQKVLESMLPFFTQCWGNASSVYGTGRESRKAVEDARKKIAGAIGAEPREILFTSGGSESDNLALKGTAFALREKGRHIITTRIEHPAVLNTCKWLEKQGFTITYIQPDREGFVYPDQIQEAMRSDTILVSVMAANNEIGTIEPVSEIALAVRERGIVFHTDAVQAVGAMDIDVNKMNIDLLSLSAHKFHGPKGIGALYIRQGSRIDNLIHGGEQERGLRAGTENTAGIVGLGTAIEEAYSDLNAKNIYIQGLRDKIMNTLLHDIPDSHLNGPVSHRLPNNCNIAFDRIDGEALLLRLDLAGIAASSGSACTAGSQQISHVLKAIGLDEEKAKGSLRITIGTENTEDEIDEAAYIIRDIVMDLRNMYHQ